MADSLTLGELVGDENIRDVCSQIDSGFVQTVLLPPPIMQQYFPEGYKHEDAVKQVLVPIVGDSDRVLREAFGDVTEFLRKAVSSGRTKAYISAKELVGVCVVLSKALPIGKAGDEGRNVVAKLQAQLAEHGEILQDEGKSEVRAVLSREREISR